MQKGLSWFLKLGLPLIAATVLVVLLVVYLPPKKIDYRWTIQTRGECTATKGTCGPGTQQYTVTCVNNKGENSDASNCDPSKKPADTQPCTAGCPDVQKCNATTNTCEGSKYKCETNGTCVPDNDGPFSDFNCGKGCFMCNDNGQCVVVTNTEGTFKTSDACTLECKSAEWVKTKVGGCVADKGDCGMGGQAYTFVCLNKTGKVVTTCTGAKPDDTVEKCSVDCPQGQTCNALTNKCENPQPVKYACQADGTCVPANNGFFSDSNCGSGCFKCGDAGQCVVTTNNDGMYKTMDECGIQCGPGTWHVEQGKCVPATGNECGTGTQTNTITCVDRDGDAVSELRCSAPRPPDLVDCVTSCPQGQTCNALTNKCENPQPVKYACQSDGSCAPADNGVYTDSTCGTGCFKCSEAGRCVVTTNNDGMYKTMDACGLQCGPGTWQRSKAGGCVATTGQCGPGSQKYIVTCVDKTGKQVTSCVEGDKPADTDPCTATCAVGQCTADNTCTGSALKTNSSTFYNKRPTSGDFTEPDSDNLCLHGGDMMSCSGHGVCAGLNDGTGKPWSQKFDPATNKLLTGDACQQSESPSSCITSTWFTDPTAGCACFDGYTGVACQIPPGMTENEFGFRRTGDPRGDTVVTHYQYNAAKKELEGVDSGTATTTDYAMVENAAGMCGQGENYSIGKYMPYLLDPVTDELLRDAKGDPIAVQGAVAVNPMMFGERVLRPYGHWSNPDPVVDSMRAGKGCGTCWKLK
jgi:hypothetical protein